MFLIEWGIGFFGAENVNVIMYLFGLFITVSFAVLGLISNWSLKITISFILIGILSIISNITDIPNIYILILIPIIIISSFLFLPKKKFNNKIIANIISMFLILTVFFSGIFILFEEVPQEIIKETKKIT
jgi:hypothetical protein